MLNPSIDPWLKVFQADRHIATLEAEIHKFCEANPYDVFVEHDAKAGLQLAYYTVRQLPPPLWGHLSGEAAHALRSALDCLANVLVAARDGCRVKVLFPIFADEAAWSKSIENINGISKSDFDKLHALQPYHSGDWTLRDLHSLDIRNTHVSLLPAVTATATPKARPRIVGPLTNISPKFIDTTKLGVYDLGFIVADSTGVELEKEWEITIEAVFGKADPLSGAPIVTSLRRFQKAVEHVIGVFDI